MGQCRKRLLSPGRRLARKVLQSIQISFYYKSQNEKMKSMKCLMSNKHNYSEGRICTEDNSCIQLRVPLLKRDVNCLENSEDSNKNSQKSREHNL